MAISGTLSSTYRGWTYRMYWSAKQSIENNQSEITVDHYLDCKSGYDLVLNTRENTCNIGGVEKTFTSPKINTGGGTTIKLGTTSHTVNHNDDGSKSCTVNSVFNIKANLSGVYKKTIAISGTITLDTIARASQPSCVTWPEHTQNVGNFGDTVAIHMNRHSDSFTHTVRYAYGSLSGTIATGVETGTTWKIPLSFMDLIPNNTSGSGTIYVDTYQGSSKIGTKSCGFTATVPSSVIPTCSIQVLDATGTKDKYGNLVKGLSKLYIKTTANGVYSSTISGYDVTADGQRYTSAEVTTDVLRNAGTVTVKSSVTDTRGRTSKQATASFPVLDYEKPKITSLAVHRCNSDTTENENGEFCRVDFSAKITPLNNKNKAAYTLKYTQNSTGKVTTVPLADILGNYNPSYSYVFPADSGSSYVVEVLAIDDIASVPAATSVSTAFTIYNVHESGTGWAFGMVAQLENTLENNFHLKQNKNTYAFSSNGGSAKVGFVHIAKITITGKNANTPMTFTFCRRKALGQMRVHVCFDSSDGFDPALKTFVYEGDNYLAYLTKSATSVWDLYVQKVDATDVITLNGWTTSYEQQKLVSVNFSGILVDQVPLGLVGYYRAGPMILRNILDAFMPVGYVLTLYDSHERMDPNVMYPNTTWVRIENRFLWGCDDKGEIGLTGGEKTHTLTTEELPEFSKGAVYSQNANADKKYTWYTAAGTNMGYGQLQLGDGAAHNNMPPYVQVSIWRRTA